MVLATANGSDTVSHALSYLESGLSVARMATDGSKAPVGRWKNFQTERMDLATARREFAGSVGICIVHGKVSGGTEVIDLDNAEVGNAYIDALAQLDNDLLQRLTIIQTPRPGYHIYYRCDEVQGNQKLAQSFNRETGQVSTLIETRGEAGVTVAPGGPREVHETRRPYVHYQGPPLTAIQRITPEERQTLINLARSFHEPAVDEPPPKPASTSPVEGISLVDDYNDRTTWEQALEPEGWLKLFSRGEVTYWRRPGKDGAGWSATTGLKSKSGRDLLCVFSTSAHPFEGATPNRACSTHSKFDVYARYHHDGDHTAAARHLGAKGFGDQQRPGMKDLTPPEYRDPIEDEPATKPTRSIPRWRKFPVHVFPRVLRNFIQESADAIGCDPSLVAIHTLAVCASIIGNSRRLQLKSSWYEPSVLWCAAVGESGVQKSPAMDAALKPLSKLQRNEFEDHRKRMEAYEVELQKYETTKGAKWKGEGQPPMKPAPPACTRYIVSDTTLEALAPIMENNHRGQLSACEELAGWFGRFDQYKSGKGGADAAAWLPMFGARELIVDRKTGDKRIIYVPRAAVSICGTIQPGVLKNALSAEHRKSGLAARFLMVYPPRSPKKWSEKEINAETEKRYAKLINRLSCLLPTYDEDDRMEPKLVRFTAQAKARFIEFADRHGEETSEQAEDIAAAYSKLEGIAARIALVFAMVEDLDHVDETSTANAIELVEWFKHETQRIYAMFCESDKVREQRELLDIVGRLSKPPHGITAADLRRRSRKFETPEAAEAALNSLVKAGYGEWHSPETGGRPTSYFRLFPADDEPQHVIDPDDIDEEYPTDTDHIDELAEACDENYGWEEF